MPTLVTIIGLPLGLSKRREEIRKIVWCPRFSADSAGQAVELVKLEADADDVRLFPFRPVAAGLQDECAVRQDLDAGIGAVGILDVLQREKLIRRASSASG
jgi:hypothetical protein